MRKLLIYISLMFLVGCTYPYFSVSKEGDHLMIRGNANGCNIDLDIPTIYVEYEYRESREEQAVDEHERIARRNERLNSPRCLRFVFDGTYNGYHIDVMLHPDMDDDTGGMARYHFKSATHDFYIETAYTWRWYGQVKDFEKVQFCGETYHAKLDKADAVKGEGNDFAEDSPFFFKDVDFDGMKEILFCAGGYHGLYYAVYKIVGNRAKLMLAEPFNNFVLAYRESLDDDSLGIYFDYRNKTITINEPMGASGYNHDVYQCIPKPAHALEPMRHLTGIHTECGVQFTTHKYLEYGKVVKVESAYPIDSVWNVVAKYNRRGKNVKLTSLELVNAHDKKSSRILQATIQRSCRLMQNEQDYESRNGEVYRLRKKTSTFLEKTKGFFSKCTCFFLRRCNTLFQR